MKENTYLTQLELADVIKISPKTLEAMRQKGTGPIYRKFGRRVLYATKDIDAFLNDHSFRSTSEY
ncbi:helix-turn-helix domain-containing protein [Mesorhizobium microcysteis]|uniref:Helix-turn-helix domain-containing protein n=1 Tax=Neoaquamicrobium microcysteis TaxID=2682781 RepID=A0A5D4H1Z5_9HYPH|nr:helix-turn-helix domain-containing protein [Mesorhizobium microcysteis]TYR34886.1 helix-turn-helix domain-containing protein [Mesorhizobium microcysteis]